jgi:hypothetical protein
VSLRRMIDSLCNNTGWLLTWTLGKDMAHTQHETKRVGEDKQKP